MGLTLANTINDMRIVVNDVVDNVAAISLDTIDNLGDVDISGVNDQHILQFNSATQNFESVEFPTTVAGSDTQIQFNNGGELSGDANLTFNISTSELSVPLVNASTLTTSTAEITTGNVDSLTANSVEVTTGNVDSLTANTLEVTTGNVDSLTANSINASGVVCASSFEGDGSSLTGIDVVNLSNVESLTFDTTGDEEFGLPVGTTAQRPVSPSQGYMRYNTSDGIGVEVYNGTRWATLGAGFAQLDVGVAELSVTANDLLRLPVALEYLVIAGGGGGGSSIGGGGGAGGYRTNAVGELSGQCCSAEDPITINSLSICITVGAGGACNVNGSDSAVCLDTTCIISCGGGRGGRYQGVCACVGGSGGGGSGGGSGDGGTNPACGIPCQGNSGGNPCHQSGLCRSSGGGGGAGGVGGNATSPSSGAPGGEGLPSCITGCCVRRAGGGAGWPDATTCDGGGATGGNGTTNTGGGGGACGAGGSGLVVLRYCCIFTITPGAGHTSSGEVVVGTCKILVITGGDDTAVVGI